MHPASVGFHCPECAKSGAQKVYTTRSIQAGTPFTYAVLASIVFVFVVQTTLGPAFDQDYLLWGPGVASNGQYWRIVTGAFLHGGLLHLLFNCYFIYNFGRYLESGLGWLRTALVYFAGLMGGSAAVLLFDWSVPTLGASGAALGMAGGAVVIMSSRGQPIMQSPLSRLLLLNLAIPFFLGGISFWGHLGGIVGGGLVGAVLGYLPRRFNQPQSVVLAVSVSVVVVLGALAYYAGTLGPFLS